MKVKETVDFGSGSNSQGTESENVLYILHFIHDKTIVVASIVLYITFAIAAMKYYYYYYYYYYYKKRMFTINSSAKLT